jgi:hypothetical protein
MRKNLWAVCLALALALLVGCRTGGPTDGGGPGGTGGPASGEPPTYPHDQVVLQLAQGGGFRMPDRVSNEIPDFTLWGDGRVVFAAPDGTVREGQLAQAAVDRLVGSAVFLYGLNDQYSAVTHTDAPTASFTVLTDRGRKTVSVYGLDPQRPQEGEPDPDVFRQMRDLWAKAYAALPADAPTMVPAAVRVMTFSGAPTEATAEWPAELQGRLTGDQAARAVALGGLGEAKLFLVDGKAMRVLVVPVLPGPGNWDDDPFRTPPELSGQAGDDRLALEARAQSQPDGGYQVTVTLKNQTDQGLQLRFDCGSLLRWQGLKPVQLAPGETTACPDVYSQLLEAAKTQTIETRLGPEAIGNPSALSVAVRYEILQADGARRTGQVSASLRPPAH